MKDVAVVIPTYNRARLIGAALDSVLAQDEGLSLEVAVIDDGSTDDTPARVQPYLDKYSAPAARITIRYTRLEKQGVVAARNTALAQTSAPLVAFLDSDDYWAPQKLAEQIARLQNDPEVGVVHTSFRYVNEAGRLTDAAPQRPNNPCAGRCLAVLLDEDLVIFSSVLLRRSVLEQAAQAEPHGLPFDPRWTNAQDYDLLLRVARLCAFAYVAQPLTFYRLHSSHGAMGNLPRAFGFHARVQLDFCRRWGKTMGWDEAEGRRRAAQFLFGRAQAHFWKRELTVAQKLCAVARELGVADQRFNELERQAGRPAWLYRVKDAVDRLIG